MTLVDAGPLVALIDADEADHEACVAALEQVTLPLRTTWPAFMEAMYLLCRTGEAAGRQALWRLVATGRLVIDDLGPEAVRRSETLMETYEDLPMDLADATLVALAEERGERRIFTRDGDVRVYQLFGRQPFEVIPV